MMAVKFSLMAFLSGIRDCHVQIHSDNTTTVAYIKNMGGVRSLTADAIARDIWDWCITRNIWISAVPVAGKDNEEADEQSRHFDDTKEWKLCPKQFKLVCQTFFHPDIDLFASRNNAQLQKFMSWKPDPQAHGIDAFSFDWARYNPYIFPPFSLVTSVLQKLRQDKVETAIVVTPNWPQHAYYSLLLNMSIRDPMNAGGRTFFDYRLSQATRIHWGKT